MAPSVLDSHFVCNPMLKIFLQEYNDQSPDYLPTSYYESFSNIKSKIFRLPHWTYNSKKFIAWAKPKMVPTAGLDIHDIYRRVRAKTETF